MSIKYRLVRTSDNIHSAGEKKTSYHPRVVRERTVGLKELCERATYATTISPIEMEASLRMAIQRIEWELLDGNHVCIDGFGTFSLTAESRPVESPDDIRAASISVKRMVFIASKILMSKLKFAKFERAKADN